MNELDLHYPPDSCPFCNIASAFTSSSTSNSHLSPSPSSTPTTSLDLAKCIPTDKETNPEKTTPSSFIVLASEDVIAFLDILPMTRGHLLVATRKHRVKVADMQTDEARELGGS